MSFLSRAWLQRLFSSCALALALVQPAYSSLLSWGRDRLFTGERFPCMGSLIGESIAKIHAKNQAWSIFVGLLSLDASGRVFDSLTKEEMEALADASGLLTTEGTLADEAYLQLQECAKNDADCMLRCLRTWARDGEVRAIHGLNQIRLEMDRLAATATTARQHQPTGHILIPSRIVTPGDFRTKLTTLLVAPEDAGAFSDHLLATLLSLPSVCDSNATINPLFARHIERCNGSLPCILDIFKLHLFPAPQAQSTEFFQHFILEDYVPAALQKAVPAASARRLDFPTQLKGIVVREAQAKYARPMPQSPQDPYFTGLGVAAIEDTPAGYQLLLPETLEITAALPQHFWDGGTVSERLKLALGTGRTETLNTTSAGSGLTADVFFVHDERPSTISSANSVSWAAYAATHVAKILRVKPESKMTFEVLAMITLRNAALKNLMTQLIAGLSFKGKPLLRMAHDFSEETQHAQGVIIEEAVPGWPLYEVQVALDTLNPATASHPKVVGFGMSQQEALAILGIQHMTKQKARQRIRSLRERIQAVEQFYRDTHPLIVHFIKSNPPLSVLRAMDRAESEAREQGFDYNHGENVRLKYDPDTDELIVIDC